MTTCPITRRSALAGLTCFGLWPASQAFAQSYPTRPIKWLVGYPAGGGTDVLARLLAGGMSSQLGQQFIIENRPGAATNLAAGEAARAEPDGYTVFTAGIETLVFNPALYKKIPFNYEKDFRPIGLTARFHLVLTVKLDSPSTTAKDLVARAKASRGTINYASPGIGSPHHLAMERLMHDAGAKLNHVPYRGMAPVINDLLGGVVEAAIVDFAAGGSVLRAGKLRPLAVCSAQRLEGLPDVPTVNEALGLKNFEAYSWQGLVAPAKTPDPIATKLTETLAITLRQQEIIGRMKEIGLDPLSGGPAEFEALLKSEREVWWPIIRDLGISLD
jgi:tripartite-type tricarboxylate transporter receptor subunit TctC